MWYEIFKFELIYRIKRPETYVFFLFLFLFSIVGVDFIFQGVDLGLMKMNAPLVIAKTMGATTGVFMIMVSMIMGVPILRDFQYNVESILFINPIKKQDYLLGRFLGSFIILLFIFSAIPLGMMLGEFMPWKVNLLPFNPITYIQLFAVVVVPSLFFGACLFFVTGMLSRKLLVVYTQGIVLFVVFLLTKAITNENLQAILDPFSLTTLTQFTKDWSVLERNSLGISLTSVMLYNKLFWMVLGLIIVFIGYRRFSFKILAKTSGRKFIKEATVAEDHFGITIPKIAIQHNFKTHCIQLFELTKFYTKSLLKETSFWGIVICGIVIILINSVSLGTVHGVDSYPATYFIVAELQEMSLYFFMIILVFYSGELLWKEREAKLDLINDATPISNMIRIAGKFCALIGIYIVLMLSLIATGILFQIASGYYQFELSVYFFGFFVEILPFLVLYTFIAFFFQVVSNHKFVGILLVLVFFIVNIGSEFFGFQHSLYKFGGKTLGIYSEMNGYGHFLTPYLWTKAYWFVFGFILLGISALFSVRGMETNLIKRLNSITYTAEKTLIHFMISATVVFVLIGSYIFYNTNILNVYWTNSEQTEYRANYEKTLKPFEYIPQPKITSVNLNVELYPTTRSYIIDGDYMLKNTSSQPIAEIHLQKIIASHVQLDSVVFEGGAMGNHQYQDFDYTIYSLSKALQPGDSIKMSFKQSFFPKGFEDQLNVSNIIHNGTFFNNQELPTIGYNKKYELRDAVERKLYELSPRSNKAPREDVNALQIARSGSDSDGIHLNVIIGTNLEQTAITSGTLKKQWATNQRNYFQYEMNQPMINFYAMVSVKYELKKDTWLSTSDSIATPVDLEIYYHKTHAYNIDRMMTSMKASLDYYSTNFSPYQYSQLRIMEFPRYAQFAQSFPGTIPFSESIGFVLDIDDEKDVDMAFYITAHEVAHQWFGMQVEAANVQGQHLILETLSQYAALMVLKHTYSEAKVQQFLESQKDTYDREFKRSKNQNPPLVLVENQDYIYYAKGAIAMYTLQETIGEDKVNSALKRFIEDWNTIDGKLKIHTNRYATSKDLIGYFRRVTPDDLQHIITELFESTSTLKTQKL